MISMILVVIFSLVWYIPVYRKQGSESKLKARYSVIGILTGMIPVFLVSAMLLQVPLTYLYRAIGLKGAAELACEAFISAGIVEEVFKFLGAFVILKCVKPQRKIDYVLIFGAVGVGFHLVEGFASGGNPLMAIFGGVIAYHIFWQYWMGMYYFKFKEARAAGRPAGKYLVTAFAVPIIMHGINDFIAFMMGGSSGSEIENFSYQWGLAYLVWFVILVVYIVITLREVFRAARESRET